MMLVLVNVTIELSNVSKNKNKETTECDKNTISYEHLLGRTISCHW